MFTLKEIIKADKLAVFHIDECSQLDIKWVWYLHLRLCQVTGQKDYPFGGVIIIFSGDFAQNANIGGDKIYDGMMRFASGNPGNLHSTIVWDACRTLAAFKTIVLDKIVRSAKDLDHCKMVTKLATGGSPSMDDIKNIKQYSQQDVEEDPSWINATWTVTTNQERLQVGYERAISWAKTHGLPLNRWRRIPMNPDDNALLLADINSDDPCLWELYVPGIIGYLRTIMNTDMKLTNGSFVIYDSLTFQSQAMSDDVRFRLKQALPGEFVTLQEPPLFLHVRPVDKESARRLGIVQDESHMGDWNCCQGQPADVFGPSSKRTNVVVPLLPGKYCEHAKYHIKGRKDGAMVELWLRASFAVIMALCMTADKMQGITLAKVVLTLAPRVQTICNFTHARFLVAFSRVRSGNDLQAIFPRNASNEIDYE